ncbi:MAG: beta-galactosidase, partial [Victivallales bacterium]|nr:beta-galactosidase [Victivallales bacterium]
MAKRLFAVLVVLSALLAAQQGGKPLEWNFKDGLQGWSTGGFESAEITEDGLHGNVKYDAMLFSPVLDIDAADYDTLAVAMKSNLSASGEIFIRAKDEKFSERKFRPFRVRESQDILIYTFSLVGLKGWEGRIEQIRFDPIDPASEITVKSIRLLKRGVQGDSVTADDGSVPYYLPVSNGIITWDFSKGMQGWKPMSWESTRIEADGFHGLSKYDCQIVSPELDIKAEDYDTMYVAMKSDKSGSGELFVSSNGSVFSERQYTGHALRASDKLELYSFELNRINGWKGVINKLRFDPLNPAGANVHISFIMLAKRTQDQTLNGDCEFFLDGALHGWKLEGAKVTDGAASGTRCLAFDDGGKAETVFPNVARLGTFKASFMSKGAPIKMDVVFMDGDGKPIETASLTSGQSDEWKENSMDITVPELAYNGVFQFAGKDGSMLDRLECILLEEGQCVSKPRLQPTWNGYWIWCEDNKDGNDCTAYVRKTFTLPDKELETADLQLTCDDSFALYINGEFVHKTHGLDNAWMTPVVLDVRKYLRKGSNTILAEVKDIFGSQGFVAELVAVAKDGEYITISTGKDWEAALAKDGPWAPAAVMGKPPCGPWFTANYRPMRVKNVGNCRIVAKLLNLPASVKAGQRIALEMDLDVEGLEKPLPARCVVSQNGRMMFEEWSENGLRIVNGRPELKLDAYFPFKLKSGKADMRVEFIGAPMGTELTAEFDVVAKDKAEYEFPKVEFVSKNGITNLMINGRLVDPTQALFTKPDWLHQTLSRDAGIHLWGVGDGNMGFTENGFDYTKFDSQMEQYLAVDPDAWLIINYSINTSAQAWWMKQHPEAHCRYEDGRDILNDYKSSKGLRPAYASKVWRETYADVIRRFIRHIRTTPYAERIVGFHSINGISAEWFHWGSQSRNFVDYSEAGRDDFRHWLKEKYKTDAALQKAWGKADVTFDTAVVPSAKERINGANGIYFDPKTQMNVLDYNDYQHDNCIETINYFNRVIKEETGGRAVCGTYYGYVFALFDSTFFGQGSGHYRVETMHRSPEFNYAIAPDSYGERQIGGTSKTMTPGGSFRL